MDLLAYLDELEGSTPWIVGAPFTLTGFPGEYRIYLCPACRYTCADHDAIVHHHCTPQGDPS